MQTGCPTDAELASFAVGELPPALVEQLATHLSGCVSCSGRLSEMDERSDDVVLAIRHASREGPVGRSSLLTADAASKAPSPLLDKPTEATDPLSISDLPGIGAAPAEEIAAGAGARIGPYRLQQLLGEGGFGSVFMAEQTSPVRRQVALKLVKLGMDTRQVLARFQAERQALAMMDHPNIARVVDAGSTERGRPYFVMELARGVAITEYCDSNHLPPRKRLELFTHVCDAVQHAHTRGVIHRDIKPSNVLITMRDGAPVPKVIDFGIAKAIGGRLTDQTLYTEIRHFLGTPEYMSPEQAEGGALEIDARTDVYSLGVLLYELLTGTTPFDAKALRAKGVDRIGQTIREIDPPKPSTRISELGASVAGVASKRGTDPKKLSQSLRGELDWIVMKCLEKDRTLRYSSVSDLVADVRRYLRDEPVQAGPPGMAYQLRKFVRRHRGGLLATATVLVAIGLGISIALSGWGHPAGTPNGADAEAARKAAEAARATELANEAKYKAQVDAVLTASPPSVVPLIDSLRAGTGNGDAAAIRSAFRTRQAGLAAGSPERLRADVALALLGDSQTDALIAAVPNVAPADGHLITAALSAATARANQPQTRPTAEVISKLTALADTAGTNVRVRARCATIALFLGDPALAQQMTAILPDPTPGYAFISEFSHWCGDLALLPAMLPKVSPELRAALCIAVGRFAAGDVPGPARQSITQALTQLATDDPSGAVHMACAYALRQWQAPVPAAASPAADDGKSRRWFVGKTGLTMVRVPAGFTVLGDERDGFPSIPALFTQPMYVSATEVPHALFKQYAEDSEVPESERPAGWRMMQERFKIAEGPSDAAAGMSLLEAARFCNWLSVKEGRTPCYKLEGDSPRDWRIDLAADGFRVPTAPEWEYFARAGSTLRYPCSDDGEYLDSIVMSMPIGTTAAANKFANVQPNRWGLVNTIGGVWEYCWYADLLNQPGQEPATGVRPVVDPIATDGGPFPLVRGGTVGSGMNELRSAFFLAGKHEGRQQTLGFRVVCAASAPGAPPEIAPPQDRSELWMWAARMRPTSQVLAGQAAEWIAAYGQLHGRHREYKKAADEFRQAAVLKKDDLTLWWYAATVMLCDGDRPGYRAACEQMLRIAAANETAGNCDRIAKVMLLDPQVAGKDLAIASDRAARALAMEDEPRYHGYFLMVNGMADYRNGKYAQAIARLKEARELLQPGPRASVDLFLAMSLHRAGQKDEAQRVLKEARTTLDANVPTDSSDWTIEWVDWLPARFALAEAEHVVSLPASP